MHPDIIDINMGCPVPKVAVKSQAGSALLKDPDKIYEIVKAVKEAVNVPVTVKIRSGWDKIVSMLFWLQKLVRRQELVQLQCILEHAPRGIAVKLIGT